MITISNLTKSFGAFYALRGVDLRIAEGTAISIFGPNGAGKSTFLRILATLSKATSGRVSIAGIDIRKEPERVRRRLGVISHATYLYDELTASENLHFYAKMYDLAAPVGRVRASLEEVGLWERRDDRVRTFSRGMQQRLSIARAMLHNPDILFLDEPYTGLDQHASKMLSGWLGKLRTEKRTIILVTHNLAHGLAFADGAVIFLRGRIVYETGTGNLDRERFQQKYFDLIASGTRV